MPTTWAISGVDLHLELRGRRVRTSLESALREAVQSGRLAPGTALPATRTLAADLGIARNTVAEAYAQLVGEGWLSARQGSGTRVAPLPGARPLAATAERGPAATGGLRYDLRPGVPDVSAFPRRDWLAATRAALLAAPAEAFSYGDPRGRPELRAALASYLSRVRGVRAGPDDVLVCAGVSQGLHLLAAALVAEGRRAIGVERYGLRRHAAVLAAAGLRVVPLELDGNGACPDGLDRLDAVLLTPGHHFPLGMALAPERRAAFVAWAVRDDGMVIEDDYDGEFRYDRRPLGAMQALAPDRVVYAGTASKALAPGLRLAWLVAPRRLTAATAERRELLDVHSPVLEQLALAELITTARYDRNVRRARLGYRQRRAELVRAIEDLPGVAVRGLDAGLHALVELPPGNGEGGAQSVAVGDAESVAVARAASLGLALEGLDTYRLGGDPLEGALVVGYARPPAYAYARSLALLRATLQNRRRSAGGRAGASRTGHRR